jgi:hypothetical protein
MSQGVVIINESDYLLEAFSEEHAVEESISPNLKIGSKRIRKAHVAGKCT